MKRDEFLASASQRSLKHVTDQGLPLPLQFRTKPYIIKGRKDSDTQLRNQHTLAPAGAKRPQYSHFTSTINSSEAFTHPHRLPAASTKINDIRRWRNFFYNPGSHRWSIHQIRAWTKCFLKWKTAYEQSKLPSHCDACKILSGGENTLNRVAPQPDFKITKSQTNFYTWEGHSGTSLLFQSTYPRTNTYFQATQSTATTVPSIAHACDS